MMTFEDEIINFLKNNKSKSSRSLIPVDIDYIEDYFGIFDFPISPLLKRCYNEVSDGGFGPGLYGTVGITPVGNAGRSGGDLLHWYLYSLDRTLEDEEAPWPHGLLPLCDHGCGIISSVWCYANNDKFPIIKTGSNRIYKNIDNKLKSIDECGFNEKYNEVGFCSYVEFKDISEWLKHYIENFSI